LKITAALAGELGKKAAALSKNIRPSLQILAFKVCRLQRISMLIN